MYLPRRHYRDIARALSDNPNADTAADAVRAINDLLDERARLVLKAANNGVPKAPRKKPEPPRSWREWLFGSVPKSE